MTKHLQRDLDELKKEILTMGALVEEATSKAIAALTNRRTDLAEEVRDGIISAQAARDLYGVVVDEKTYQVKQARGKSR